MTGFYSRRVDANQDEIVKGLRSIPGVSVALTHRLGKGFPDLAVGRNKTTYLLEVKDGTKPPSARQLTKEEADWHGAWTGHAAVVATLDEAIDVIMERTNASKRPVVSRSRPKRLPGQGTAPKRRRSAAS